MMLDKNTFGSTPAAVYLADRLNELNQPRLTTNVTHVLCCTQRILGELVNAHTAGFISSKTIAFLTEKMRVHTQNTSHDMLHDKEHNYDPTVINLMTNVLCGSFKNVQRRAQQANIKNKQSKKLPVEQQPKAATINDFQDQITGIVLEVKAMNRRLRREKKNV